MQFFWILWNCAALCWGGAVDYRRREIPNEVPVALLVTGVLQWGWMRLWALLGVALALCLTGKLLKSPLPGGDFKLLCALAFAVGIDGLLMILFFAGIILLVYSMVKNLPLWRNIPLCTYIAPAYMAYAITLLF